MSKNTLHGILGFWPSLIVLLVILYATWVPQPIDPDDIPPIPHIDKLIHAIMMGGLCGALMFDYYRNRLGLLTPRTIIAFTVAVMAFSAVDEWMQGVLPIGRPSDFIDLLADWGGCLVAAFAAPPVIRKVIKL